MKEEKEFIIALILTVAVIASYFVLSNLAYQVASEGGYEYIVDEIMPFVNFLYLIYIFCAGCYFSFFGYIQIEKRIKTFHFKETE